MIYVRHVINRIKSRKQIVKMLKKSKISKHILKENKELGGKRNWTAKSNSFIYVAIFDKGVFFQLHVRQSAKYTTREKLKCYNLTFFLFPIKRNLFYLEWNSLAAVFFLNLGHALLLRLCHYLQLFYICYFIFWLLFWSKQKPELFWRSSAHSHTLSTCWSYRAKTFLRAVTHRMWRIAFLNRACKNVTQFMFHLDTTLYMAKSVYSYTNEIWLFMT